MIYLIGAAIAAVLDWAVMGWLFNVPLIWPTIMFHVLFVLIVMVAVSAIKDKISSRAYYFDATKPTMFLGGFAVAVVLVLLLVLVFAEPMNTDKLRDLGKIEVVEERLEVADTGNIRVNPKESAKFVGSQKIGKGNYGSRFNVGEYDVQRNIVEGKSSIVWLAPLDFQGFFKWLNAKESPGYVVVSAEDVNEEPRFVDTYHMKYMPSAYWGNNLRRHLYFNGYASYWQTETTFEADDTGKPYYVVSMTQPSVGFSGRVLKKVVVVDPENGEIQAYEPGKTPAWVDRAFPETLAKEYANYWGKYVISFFNTWFARKDMMQVSGVQGADGTDIQDVFLVHNKETSNSNWVCGMTSPSMADKAMTGYMTMDSITGKMKFYRIDSMGNEDAVVKAVNSAKVVSEAKTYRAAQPILYNIYGEDSWVVPVLSDNDVPEMVAVVYAKDVRHVVVGNNKTEALDLYKTMLAELRAGGTVPTEAKETKSITGTVLRISAADANGRRQFLLKEHPSQMFEAIRVSGAEILITEVGDKVQLSYLDTGEDVVSVKSFDNLNLFLTKSEPQLELEAQEAREASATAADLKKQQDELQQQIDALQDQIDDTTK